MLHSRGINATFISRDCTFIPSSVAVKVWDMEKRFCMRTLTCHPGSVCSIDVGRAGSYAVSWCFYENGSIKVWQLPPNASIPAVELRTYKGDTAFVAFVKICPDGTKLASGPGYSTVIWDVQRSEELHT